MGWRNERVEPWEEGSESSRHILQEMKKLFGLLLGVKEAGIYAGEVLWTLDPGYIQLLCKHE